MLEPVQLAEHRPVLCMRMCNQMNIDIHKLKPYKCNINGIQTVSLAQEIHVGANLMFVSHSKSKL